MAMEPVSSLRSPRGVSFAAAKAERVAENLVPTRKSRAKTDEPPKTQMSLSQRAAAMGFGMGDAFDLISKEMRARKKKEGQRTSGSAAGQRRGTESQTRRVCGRAFESSKDLVDRKSVKAQVRKAKKANTFNLSRGPKDDSSDDAEEEADKLADAGESPSRSAAAALLSNAATTTACLAAVKLRKEAAREAAKEGGQASCDARPQTTRRTVDCRRVVGDYKETCERARSACGPWSALSSAAMQLPQGEGRPQRRPDERVLLFDGIDLGYDPKDPCRLRSTRLMRDVQEEARGWLEACVTASCPSSAKPIEMRCVFDTATGTDIRYALAYFDTMQAALQALEACRRASVEPAAQQQATSASWRRCSLASPHDVVGSSADRRWAAARAFGRPGGFSCLSG